MIDQKYKLVISIKDYTHIPEALFDQILAWYKDLCGIETFKQFYYFTCHKDVVFDFALIADFGSLYAEFEV